LHIPWDKRRQELQRVGTRSAKRRLKKLSGREKRFQKDTNHKIAKTLVHKAVVSRKALALEDLTGIRERTTVRRENRYERHCWALLMCPQHIGRKRFALSTSHVHRLQGRLGKRRRAVR
jgi:putative transposase